MKFSLLLLLVAATLGLNACTTLANRRDLYFPAKAHGPYNDMLYHAQAQEVEAQTPRVKNHDQQPIFRSNH